LRTFAIEKFEAELAALQISWAIELEYFSKKTQTCNKKYKVSAVFQLKAVCKTTKNIYTCEGPAPISSLCLGLTSYLN